MPIVFDNLKVKGALANFHQALEAAPSVWQNHCQIIPATTKTEALVFPGFQPTPRRFLDGRQFQGMLDFRYNVSNLEYELSLLVPQADLEDDQTGLTMARMSELGEVWRTYKDQLFRDLLINGNVAGNTGWDGVVFHGDSRTIGSSGTIDNNRAATAVIGTVLRSEEFLDMVADARTAFLGYNDDYGRPFNTQAVTKMRFVVPPIQARAGYEAMNQTITAMPGSTTPFAPAGVSNVYGRFIDGVDELPYLASDPTNIFASALGSARKPFIMMERTNLEILMYSDAMEITRNRGLQVLCRQRFIETYGEPRRSILYIVA